MHQMFNALITRSVGARIITALFAATLLVGVVQTAFAQQGPLPEDNPNFVYQKEELQMPGSTPGSSQPDTKNAQAGWNPGAEAAGCGWLSLRPSCVFYWIIDTITDFIVVLLVPFSAFIFNVILEYALRDLTGTAIVKIGSEIVLATANLFFVLILLWIAIATIFDWAEYSARSLLPKLIMVALLINFSVAIGGAIINLSNGIAKTFYCNIVPTAIACGGGSVFGGTLSIPQQIMNVSSMQKASVVLPKDALPNGETVPKNLDKTFSGGIHAILIKLLLVHIT